MPSWESLVVFLVAAVLFAVSPGPAVFYIVTRSLVQGRGCGVVSALAVATANLVHVVAALVGLSAMLAASAVAFGVVKYLGAAYLIYLGLRTLLRRDEGGIGQPVEPAPRWRVFRQGVVVGVLNPKTALFFLAFLSQFIDPSGAPAALQVGVLGVLLVAVTALSDVSYALITGAAGQRLRRSARIRRSGKIASGTTYIALGTTAALTGERPAAV
ncbi:LysE family translocator [Saccharopolyspora flava]|uniref:Threonine/homoserine/homoserine lactone efflux protein n=1 Tax=Saccharopolyspora flava TaxID=95161 RepID=A0A1I6SUB8_9PSEU|nr:LysE family translocator [Saccharopolyspora flava]SFS80482.1 Threonine/homoserine/homoserine lactone efflux protein [Saccharopolyspora flava]